MDRNESLVIENLTARFGSTEVLRDVSFAVPRGSWVSIVGPNGAGKSTLLKTLMGIIEPSGGIIEWGGQRMNTLAQRERARYFSYVPQQFSVDVGFSVKEFLTLSRYSGDQSSVDLVVAESIQCFGLTSLTSRSVAELSAGEMQRVLVAAAIVQGSDVILMDEPAAFLDPGQERDVMGILSRVKREQQKTVFSVTHDLTNAFELGDRCVVMDRGSVAFAGSPDELRKSSVLKQVFSRNFVFIDAGRAPRTIVVPE